MGAREMQWQGTGKNYLHGFYFSPDTNDVIAYGCGPG